MIVTCPRHCQMRKYMYYVGLSGRAASTNNDSATDKAGRSDATVGTDLEEDERAKDRASRGRA